jgi:hypothetical protein
MQTFRKLPTQAPKNVKKGEQKEKETDVLVTHTGADLRVLGAIIPFAHPLPQPVFRWGRFKNSGSPRGLGR